jgi:hypothetical protein
MIDLRGEMLHHCSPILQRILPDFASDWFFDPQDGFGGILHDYYREAA